RRNSVASATMASTAPEIRRAMLSAFDSASMSVVVSYPGATQNGPWGGSLIVSVPRGGPRHTAEVSTKTVPLASTVTTKRSVPRGAGPSWYSPAPLYFEPWQGHSNHLLEPQNGTRHPRGPRRGYSAMMRSFVTPVSA